MILKAEKIKVHQRIQMNQSSDNWKAASRPCEIVGGTNKNVSHQTLKYIVKIRCNERKNMASIDTIILF